MARAPAQTSAPLVAGISRSLVRSGLNVAAAASASLSDALVEAAQVPLYIETGAPTPRIDLTAIPLHAVDLFFSRTLPAPPTLPGPGVPAVRIVAEAVAYLGQVPGQGMLLRRLVTHVADATGFEDRLVRTIIRQNFRSDGILVWR